MILLLKIEYNVTPMMWCLDSPERDKVIPCDFQSMKGEFDMHFTHITQNVYENP